MVIIYIIQDQNPVVQRLDSPLDKYLLKPIDWICYTPFEQLEPDALSEQGTLLCYFVH